MAHMVIYRGADGKPGFQQIDDLAAAVAYVEKLRNEQSVENSRIYRLEQVQYRFETYFQVRLDDGPALPLSTTSAPIAPAKVGTEVPSAPEAVLAAERPAPPMAPTPPSPPTPTRTPVTASVAAPVGGVAEEATEASGEVADAANGIRRGLFGR